MAKFALSNPIIKRACNAVGGDIVFDFGEQDEALLTIRGVKGSINLVMTEDGMIKAKDLQADEALRMDNPYYRALKSNIGTITQEMCEQAIKTSWREVYHTVLLETLVERSPEELIGLIGSRPILQDEIAQQVVEVRDDAETA